MGGSGIAGDVLAAVAGPFMPVPVAVVKGYEAPAFVGRGHALLRHLVLGRHRGDASRRRRRPPAAGARMVVLSHRRRARPSWPRRGTRPHIALPDIPMPRAGIGAVSIPPLVVLERVGPVPGRDAVRRRRRRPARSAGATSSSSTAGPAQRLAREHRAHDADRLRRRRPRRGGRLPLEEPGQRERQGAGVLGRPSRSCAHNEICGWGQHGDVTRQVITLVRFRHDFEHPQVTPPVRPHRRRASTRSCRRRRRRAPRARARSRSCSTSSSRATSSASTWPPRRASTPGPIPVLDDLKAALAQLTAHYPGRPG